MASTGSRSTCKVQSLTSIKRCSEASIQHFESIKHSPWFAGTAKIGRYTAAPPPSAHRNGVSLPSWQATPPNVRSGFVTEVKCESPQRQYDKDKISRLPIQQDDVSRTSSHIIQKTCQTVSENNNNALPAASADGVQLLKKSNKPSLITYLDRPPVVGRTGSHDETHFHEILRP